MPRLAVDEVIAAEDLAAARTASSASLFRPPRRGGDRPAHLNDAFALPKKELGEPGAVAAGALHSPAPPVRQITQGKAQQVLITIGAGRGLRAGHHRPDRGDRGGGQVSRWVSTPMTPSIGSVRMFTWCLPCRRQQCRCLRPWGHPGRTVMSHAGADGLFIKPRVGQLALRPGRRVIGKAHPQTASLSMSHPAPPDQPGIGHQAACESHSCVKPAKGAVEVAGEVALDAAADFAVGFAFGACGAAA